MDELPPTALDPRFLLGLEHFVEGRFYEAHEPWEDLWAGEVGATKRLVQALIQVTVALHHRDCANLGGAATLFEKALPLLALLPNELHFVDVRDLERRTQALLAEVKTQRSRANPVFEPSLVPEFRGLLERLQAQSRAAGFWPPRPDLMEP